MISAICRIYAVHGRKPLILNDRTRLAKAYDRPELTKAVLEGDGDTNSAKGRSISVLALPATLHASLMARLDRLGLGAKQVAQTGAAIGREFAYELLGAAAGLTERELRDELARLVNS
jgi:predicted ATPase